MCVPTLLGNAAWKVLKDWQIPPVWVATFAMRRGVRRNGSEANFRTIYLESRFRGTCRRDICFYFASGSRY